MKLPTKERREPHDPSSEHVFSLVPLRVGFEPLNTELEAEATFRAATEF